MADAILHMSKQQSPHGSRNIDGKDQRHGLRHGETHGLGGVHRRQSNNDGNPGLIGSTT